MSKLNLAILDSDVRYMDNFAGYVTGHYRHRFNLSTFTSAEALIGYIRQKGARVDILLISVAEYGDWLTKLDPGLIILLSGAAQQDERLASRGIEGFGSVERYCGADKLVADILKIYANSEKQPVYTETVHGDGENKIITIISAEGGSGRTSIAIALSAHFSKLKLKTLYICLDFMGGGEFASDDEMDGGLSDIIYTLKTRPDRLGLKMEALGKSAPGAGFFYFSPPLYPMDVDEITSADIETLIAGLRGAAIYDRVVIDTHNGLSLRNKTLIELADSILLVSGNAGAGIKKLHMLKAQIDKSFGAQAGDIYKRFHIILNRVYFNNQAAPNGRPSGFAGGYDTETALDESAEGIAGAFLAKVTVLPFCADMCGDYDPGALAGISGGFGAAIAEVARRA